MSAPDQEWGPWIEHDQSGIPVPIGTLVHRVFDIPPDFGVAEGQAEFVGIVTADERGSWSGSIFASQIIRYRIRKPRGMAILSDLVESLPEPTDALTPDVVQEA